MQSSDAKRCSSSLKACPLTKEVTKEEIRDEEEEGMEMHGEFPACKREKMLFLARNLEICRHYTRNLNDHKNYVHWDA